METEFLGKKPRAFQLSKADTEITEESQRARSEEGAFSVNLCDSSVYSVSPRSLLKSLERNRVFRKKLGFWDSMSRTDRSWGLAADAQRPTPAGLEEHRANLMASIYKLGLTDRPRIVARRPVRYGLT